MAARCYQLLQLMEMKHFLEYIILRLACFTIKALPVKFAIFLGKTMGFLAARLLKSRVRLASSNLNHAFGDSLACRERRQIIRRLFALLGESFIESVIFTQEEIDENVIIENFRYVTDALKSQKGVIILAPHFGPWEVASYVLGTRIPNAATIYKPLKNEYVNNYLIALREKISHLHLIPSKNAVRPVLETLRKGNAVVILFDQNAGKTGIPATFFGKTALTYPTPAALALQTGSLVVPGYITKDDGFRRFRIVFEEPFPLIKSGNKKRDVIANTQQYNDFLEKLVRKHPDQWFGWLHNRWKLPRSFREESAVPQS